MVVKDIKVYLKMSIEKEYYKTWANKTVSKIKGDLYFWLANVGKTFLGEYNSEISALDEYGKAMVNRMCRS